MKVLCPHCHRVIEVSVSRKSLSVACPACETLVLLPAPPRNLAYEVHIQGIGVWWIIKGILLVGLGVVGFFRLISAMFLHGVDNLLFVVLIAAGIFSAWFGLGLRRYSNVSRIGVVILIVLELGVILRGIFEAVRDLDPTRMHPSLLLWLLLLIVYNGVVLVALLSKEGSRVFSTKYQDSLRTYPALSPAASSSLFLLIPTVLAGCSLIILLMFIVSQHLSPLFSLIGFMLFLPLLFLLSGRLLK